MNFIVTLFLQNHYFFEKQSIFSAFSRKTRSFFRERPDFFSIFPKNNPIFSPNAEKSQISILLNFQGISA